MSFGYGIGDILAVIKLTKNIVDKIRKSPPYARDARDEYDSYVHRNFIRRKWF